MSYKFRSQELENARGYIWDCHNIVVDELPQKVSKPIIAGLEIIEKMLIEADKPPTTKELVEQFVYRLNNDPNFYKMDQITDAAEEMLKQIIANEGQEEV